MAAQLHSLTDTGTLTSIYLSTNKGVFETGEDLWFRATILNAQVFIPSPIDKTLYVQLRNIKNDSVVWREKYEIVNGFSDGQIYLNDTLDVGNYFLEAYSRHSFKSEITEYHGVRKIKLVNRINEYIEKTNTDITAKTLDPDTTQKVASTIQFKIFPEGGSLIDGIKSQLAFKAVDSTGIPIAVSGTLYENQKPLLKFTSIHAGMGSFSFVPNIKNSYLIKLKSKDKCDSISYDIPEIQQKGFSFHLARRDSEKLVFKVRGNTADGQLYLRAQIRGQVQAMASAHIQDSLELTIPTKDFLQGICEVTLFDEQQRPVAERLVYVNSKKRLQVSYSLSKKIYNTKEKVDLKIKVTDNDGNPIQSNLALSVYDRLYKNPEDGKNILTHYELSTQLKGSIYNPNYYFDEENEDRQKMLDLLLLTQGWRKYVWTEKKLKKNNGHLILEDGIIGKVITIPSKKNAIEQQGVMTIDPESGQVLNLVPLDSLKRFYIKSDYLSLGPRIYIQHFEPEDGPEVKVKVSDGYEVLERQADQYTYNYPINSNRKENQEPIASTSMTQGIYLDEVLVKGQKIKGSRDKYLAKLDSLAKLNLIDDYVASCGILNCPAEAAGKKPIEGKRYTAWISDRNPGSHPYNFTADEMQSIVYHYPKLTEDELLEKFNLTKTKGYYQEKKFYEPNYDSEDDSFPDYRNTLVWKPQIITDDNGEAELSFFCSDISSYFVGIIEGVSENGLLGSKEFGFYVKNNL
ncbi:hypothetical protein ACFSYG_09500 [Leeuwenhoekiella polynyae]|nr:hypothetical protein [Leeuwenhoekiella polynyae]